jgi:hypothetical protein
MTAQDRDRGRYPDLFSLRVCVYGSSVSLLLELVFDGAGQAPPPPPPAMELARFEGHGPVMFIRIGLDCSAHWTKSATRKMTMTMTRVC